MTRKDFIVLADACGEALADCKGQPGFTTGVRWLIDKIKAKCKADNPRFDAVRFQKWVEKVANDAE